MGEINRIKVCTYGCARFGSWNSHMSLNSYILVLQYRFQFHLQDPTVNRQKGPYSKQTKTVYSRERYRRAPHKPAARALLLERHGALPPNLLVRTIWLHGQPCGPRGSRSVAPPLGAKRRRPVASALSPQSSVTPSALHSISFTPSRPCPPSERRSERPGCPPRPGYGWG